MKTEINEICDRITNLLADKPLNELIDSINTIRESIHSISPFKNERLLSQKKAKKNEKED